MISRIQALIEKATPGPWRWEEDRSAPDTGDIISEAFERPASFAYENDGQFIAHARQLLPLMLAVAEDSRALFMGGLDDPPNSVIFDPHGAVVEVLALAEALASLESYCAERLPEPPA